MIIGIRRSCNMGCEFRQHQCICPFSFLTSPCPSENGHGSHVAGTVGGTTYGVAKSVSLVAVKVLDADGAGTNSGVIQGLNFGISPILTIKVV
jgi:hypothetical protein